jgi:hypothetical protein
MDWWTVLGTALIVIVWDIARTWFIVALTAKRVRKDRRLDAALQNMKEE